MTEEIYLTREVPMPEDEDETRGILLLSHQALEIFRCTLEFDIEEFHGLLDAIYDLVMEVTEDEMDKKRVERNLAECVQIIKVRMHQVVHNDHEEDHDDD